MGESLHELAATKLFQRSVVNSKDYKLCVHTRRGDFVYSKAHQESTEFFTVNSISYIADSSKL
uniref:SH2 domain-containing protein n=1 Tax=Ascaris lumbricoides TaxID=6252 RepID=A0A0M3HWD6_ASCLU